MTMLAALPKGRPQHIIFFGTPDVAVGPLRTIVKHGFTVDLVVTGVDKRRGRGSEISPSPVKHAATELGLKVSHNVHDAVNLAAKFGQDVLGVVVAYGHIIPESVLELIPMINIHYSLLPRWRGAAPVERALLAGDEETGVCVIKVAPQLDAGDILSSAKTKITTTDTVSSLRNRLEQLAEPLLLSILTSGAKEGSPQNGDVVIAKKISNTELQIDWTQNCSVVDRQVRVGGAFTSFNAKRFKIHSLNINHNQLPESFDIAQYQTGSVLVHDEMVLVVCGDGFVELGAVQPEGKSQISAHEWKKGARLDSSSRFG